MSRITTAEVAVIINASPQFVRIAMQRDLLPIGSAVKMSSIWTYNISPALLAARQGMTQQQLEERLTEIRMRNGHG